MPVEEEQVVEKVLVVDDDRDAMVTLGILLRTEGYIVSLASNGNEALAMAQARLPDVALIDLQMPGSSGFEVARELYRRHGEQRPLLIAITAHADSMHRERAQQSGFDHFVEKPYQPDALLELIDSLRRRQLT